MANNPSLDDKLRSYLRDELYKLDLLEGRFSVSIDRHDGNNLLSTLDLALDLGLGTEKALQDERLAIAAAAAEGEVGSRLRREMNKASYSDFLGSGWKYQFDRDVVEALESVRRPHRLDEYLSTPHLRLLAEYYEIKIVLYRPISLETDERHNQILSMHPPISIQDGEAKKTAYLLFDGSPTLGQF